MAYVKGSTILAADLNGLMSTINSVYGVGSGNYGYGQTAISTANVTAGSQVMGSHWTNLRSIINICSAHQGIAQTLMPPSGVLASGQPIVAHESSAPSNNTYDFDGIIANCAANRLVAAASSMTLTSSAHSVTRASTWSSTISTTVDVQFGSENNARYFFNSGGQIRFRVAHPNGTATQDDSWREIVNTMLGTLTMSATSVSISGVATSSLVPSLGFYNLAASAQTIFNGNDLGSGAYAGNDLTVTAQVLNRVGTNGGNGTAIRFVISMNDSHTGFYDSVSSGTNVSFSHYRATAYLAGIVTPTYATQVAF